MVSKMNGKQQRHPLCGLDDKFSYSNLIAIGLFTIDLSELDENIHDFLCFIITMIALFSSHICD